MANKFWHVIGLMSGTSLDGVDLALVKFSAEKGYAFEILKAESINYSEKWKNSLSDAFRCSGEELRRLDVEYGHFLSELIMSFIAKNKIGKPDLIASHGHTIFHRPEEGYTLQIGNGAVIAARTGIRVVCDFRTQDVALGGQGAPLVPIGDELLFSDYDFCLNIGGFANISYQVNGQRRAFDICPANIVLNHYSKKVGLDYDDKGQLAARGEVNGAVIEELDQIPFYRDLQPKSLGFEFVLEQVLPIIDRYRMSTEDTLRTFVEHAATQIAQMIDRETSAQGWSRTVTLVTGGGVFNEFLIGRIDDMCSSRIVIPSREFVEFKEALIFALLGLLRIQGKINCLKSVTGASQDHSSGIIYEINKI